MESSSKSDISTFYGQCRCCLEYGYMKNLWTEHNSEGIREVFGEMLLETFSINWETVDELKDYICESCVIRLRDAYEFKKEVLSSQQLISEGSCDFEQDSDYKVEMLEESDELENADELEEVSMEEEQNDIEVKTDLNDTEYFEVEYLEDDETVEVKDETLIQTDTKSNTETDKPKTKWPRKKKPNEIIKQYKDYSEEDMRQCLELVRSNKMSISDASKLYGIPRKTVAGKISYVQKKKLETEEDIQKQQNLEKQFEFASELRKVLSYTNAIPFKVKTAKYFCAYCRRDSFDDPDDLRNHSRTHKDVWLKRVDHIIRPHFQNEILRFDIEALHCVACDTPIKTWNDMFQHLREHGVELDQVYTRVVPYRLRQDSMHCALCDERFLNFGFLDSHMNSHYCNYMCSECGDTFVAETRLKHHLEIHNKGRHPCPECGKVFPLEKYMKKHYAMVHKKNKAFKCMYCDQRFHGEYERHSHVLEVHRERVRISTCELCGKTFDWRPYYMAHLRKVHSKEKKNKCRYCGKAFVTKHEVKMHEQRHTGSGKHVCKECGKNYVTNMELRLHLKKHAKESALMRRS